MADYFSIDHIEGDTAICERDDRTKIDIPLNKLPKAAKEGDCIREEGGAFVIDEGETDRRRKLNIELFRKLLY